MRVFPYLMAGVVLVGCSSDTTGPGDGGGGAVWALKLSVSNIVVNEMCDGFPIDVNGGEWTHKLSVRFPGETSVTLGSTSGYPSASGAKNIGRGGNMALTSSQKTQNRDLTSKEGDKITLTLRATEWDYDILGNNPFPDSRMNDRSATNSVTYRDGKWPQISRGILTLKNSSSCQVTVNYTVEAVKK